MADTLTRRSPLHSHQPRLAALPASASVAEEPFFSMVDLWVDPARPGADAAADVLGIDALPTTPSTVVDAPDTSVIWLGPQEWLAVSADRAGEQMEAALRAATAAHGGAAVDVSAQRTSLRLRGANARALLAKGCSLDLHPQAFGPGDAAQTMLGHAGVVLMPMSDDGTDYRVIVRASYARYLADWLIDAAEEFSVDW
ncbi:sarcosine oxidase subunit gamma [Mycolicibacterium obuense]|uniref:Sarcosine oxidase subunit gamma n=1 Tax=Mycolicibacterium obuense TaxID=1807 RepID=A0A0M2K765_9MYCO|nr:sarcosine oxidase subunit gamma family protein [Mycolicibacterium obuense]KKF02838.1 sarcosine oxidase subunit gamma [Mycolicibacterium obuense]